MTTNPTRILLASMLLAGATAAPATAATVRHVETTGTDNPACSADAPCRTLYQAVGVAQGGDTIELGEGAFDYPGVVAKPLTFEGTGPETVLAGGLTIGADATVRALRAVPGGNSVTFYVPSDFAPALHLEDVVVAGADAAVYIRGGSLVADHVTVAGTGADTEGLSFYGTSAVLRHVSFDATSGLLRSVLHGDGEMHIEDSRLTGRYGASSATGGFALERSRIDAAEVALGLGAGADGETRSIAIADSVLLGRGATGPGLAIDAQNISDGATLDIDVQRSTLVAGGDGSRALQLLTVGGTSHATLTGSVAAAKTDVFARGSSVEAAGSAFRTAYAGNGAIVTTPGSAGNLAVDPRLAEDGTLMKDSPLIDAGDATPLPADLLDAAGAPRVADGDGDGVARVDVGGLERSAPQITPAPPSPSPSPSSPPAAPAPAGAAPDTLAPLVRDLEIIRGTRTRARFTLSEAAEVRVTLRRVKGKVVRCLVRQRGAGRAAVKFRRADLARRGRYAVRVVAVDASGNRSAAVRRTFRVRPR